MHDPVQIEHDLESLHAKVCELRTEHVFFKAQKCIKHKKKTSTSSPKYK